MNLKNSNFFCSWSGGKDSCLSLYRGIKEGGNAKLLFTMFTENGRRSRSHGLDKKIIEMQSHSLGIPLKVCSASWQDYEKVFVKTLKDIKKKDIDIGIFGDIDIEEHKDWVTSVCDKALIQPYLPLWKGGRIELLNEFISLGFKAQIVAMKDGIMDKSFLGKTLDQEIVKKLKDMGIDPSGENGEFHTVVTDGPIFRDPIRIRFKDEVLNDGYWFIDAEVI